MAHTTTIDDNRQPRKHYLWLFLFLDFIYWILALFGFEYVDAFVAYIRVVGNGENESHIYVLWPEAISLSLFHPSIFLYT